LPRRTWTKKAPRNDQWVILLVFKNRGGPDKSARTYRAYTLYQVENKAAWNQGKKGYKRRPPAYHHSAGKSSSAGFVVLVERGLALGVNTLADPIQRRSPHRREKGEELDEQKRRLAMGNKRKVNLAGTN